jgi:hypothetical protein
MKYLAVLLTLLTPVITHAQSVQSFVAIILAFITNTLIPFILGIAFLIFVINAVRFFVIGGANEDSQEKAKALVLYSLMAFVFILSFWGLVNILAGSFFSPLDANPDCHFRVSDYIANDTEPCDADPYSFGPG